MSYFQLVRSRPRILVFGLLATFLSSFGQTFFIGAFGEAWRHDFGLSNTAYGGIYSLATLASCPASARWRSSASATRRSSYR